jgi:hypothetical protein
MRHRRSLDALVRVISDGSASASADTLESRRRSLRPPGYVCVFAGVVPSYAITFLPGRDVTGDAHGLPAYPVMAASTLSAVAAVGLRLRRPSLP